MYDAASEARNAAAQPISVGLANLPSGTEVRFLVDGLQRPTLAGHADLTRTYLVSDAETAEAAHP